MAINESDLLGRLAEQEFSTWATRGDITINKVELDRHGWDFMLQIPYRSESRSAVQSLDKMGPELTCKVQVKATEQLKSSCDDINLENWSRMVSEPIPWFIAILIYESRELKDAFLVHVDEKLMARALKRLREVANSDKDNLHKKSMSVAWTDKDKIDRPFHVGLTTHINASIGNGLYEYVEKKRKLYQTLGYDDFAAQGRVTFQVPVVNDPASLWNALSDHAIGIAPNMPVSMIDLNEVRFGIPLPISGTNSKVEDFRIEDPKVDTGQISFYNKKWPAKVVHIECTFYHAGVVFPFIPEEYKRIRIQTRFFSIILDPLEPDLTLKVSVSIQPEQGETIADLLKYARFILMCSEGSDGDAFFKLNLHKLKDSANKEYPIAKTSFPDEVRQTAQTIEHLWDILRFFDIDADNRICLARIWEQPETIKFFQSAINVAPSHREGQISFRTVEDLDGQQVAVAFGSFIIIGSYAVIIVVAFMGKCNVVATLSESSTATVSVPMRSYEISSVSKEVLRSEKYLWSEGTKIALKEIVEEGCETLAKRGFFVMAPQILKSYKPSLSA